MHYYIFKNCIKKVIIKLFWGIFTIKQAQYKNRYLFIQKLSILTIFEIPLLGLLLFTQRLKYKMQFNYSYNTILRSNKAKIFSIYVSD